MHASSSPELDCQERFNESVCKGLEVFTVCLHMAHKNREIMFQITFLFAKSHYFASIKSE